MRAFWRTFVTIRFYIQKIYVLMRAKGLSPVSYNDEEVVILVAWSPDSLSRRRGRGHYLTDREYSIVVIY